jgi:ferredoxin-NADP reductase
VHETDLRLRVVKRTTVATDVVALELADPDSADLPEWTPGSHIDLRLAPDLVRQYSLCGDPADRGHWRIAVLREPKGRGGSARVHTLSVGDTIDVRGPRNHFELRESACYVFVAGGIGITPILPMIAAADAAGAKWELHYGGRTSASMAYARDLADRHGNAVHLHPQDTDGLLDLDAILATPRADTAVYSCGPETLLQAVEQRCSSWLSGSLHIERFVPKANTEPPVNAGSFEVELAQSGTVVTVEPGQSVLDAVEQAGVPVLSSCQEGTCGTCETGVLSGAVDHRDSLLSPEEQEAGDVMFICVSRAAGPRLVLDL